jgi:murein DD-endopeptidase MepM/ murein hydrolase activator NlpD
MVGNFLWAKSTRIMKQLIKRQLKNIQKQIQKKFVSLLEKISKSFIKPLSRIGIHFFEHKKIKQIVGGAMVVLVILSAILPPSLASAKTATYNSVSQNEAEIQLVETEKSLRLPVENFVITQNFSFFHPGIDLAAIKGSPVYPIADGVVAYTNHSQFGYGNEIIINHGSGLKSLYAHLSKIEVKEGEKVTKDSLLGLVGSTGWSTGPHLHLQIWEEDRWVNPRTFFEGYFGQKLASTR